MRCAERCPIAMPVPARQLLGHAWLQKLRVTVQCDPFESTTPAVVVWIDQLGTFQLCKSASREAD